METVTDFIFLGSKTTVDSDYSHEIKRRLLLGRKAMTNLDSVLKSRDSTLPIKGPYSQSYGFSSSHVWMPMDYRKPGFSVLHYVPELAQTHILRVSDSIQPSHPLSTPFSFCFQSFPASGSLPKSQLFTSGGHSIGASASASVLPMNIQD